MLDAYGNTVVSHADYERRARAERAKVAAALLSRAAGSLEAVVGRAARGLWRAGRTAVSGVALARRRHVAFRQLQAMDDRLLKDIGISRSEIPFMVRHGLSVDRAAVPAEDATAASPRASLRPPETAKAGPFRPVRTAVPAWNGPAKSSTVLHDRTPATAMSRCTSVRTEWATS